FSRSLSAHPIQRLPAEFLCLVDGFGDFIRDELQVIVCPCLLSLRPGQSLLGDIDLEGDFFLELRQAGFLTLKFRLGALAPPGRGSESARFPQGVGPAPRGHSPRNGANAISSPRRACSTLSKKTRSRGCSRNAVSIASASVRVWARSEV